jgi:hypothetical protein
MMDDRPNSRQPATPQGLCANCLHARVITSDRGSQFVFCDKSRTDPAFARYPRLPVAACSGYAVLNE